MADVTPEYLRGFLVPMDLGGGNIWNAQSGFTQQNSSAGDPEPQQNTPMRVIATGNQSTNGDISIVTRFGGTSQKGRFTFTDNTDSNTIEYGMDSLNAISGFEAVRATGIDDYNNLDSHVDNANNLYITYHKLDASNHKMAGYTKITNQGTKSETIIYNSGATAYSQKYHTAMVTMEDGSLMFYHTIIQTEGFLNVRGYRSQDNGSTWTMVTRDALPEDIPVNTMASATSGSTDFFISTMKIEQINGVFMLLMETVNLDTDVTKRNQLFQYVSIDNGMNFSLVTTQAQAGANSFHSIDLKARLGLFVLTYCADRSTIHYMELPNGSSNIHLMRNAQEYVPLTGSFTVTNGSDNYMENGNMCLIVDDNGLVYINFLTVTVPIAYIQLASLDGISFSQGGAFNYYRYLFNTKSGTNRIANICGNHWMGRGVLPCNALSTSITNDNLYLVYLGGYGNVNLPRGEEQVQPPSSAQVQYSSNYLAIDLPVNIGNFTKTGTASEAMSITTGFLKLESSTTHNSNVFYTFNDVMNTHSPSSNNEFTTKGAIVRFTYKVTAGGSLLSGNDNSGIDVIISNGTTGYKIRAIATTTQLRIIDLGGSATIGTVIVNMTAGVDLYIALSAGKVATYYRALDNAEKRKFTTGPSSTSVGTMGSPPSAGITVSFGHLSYFTSTTMKSEIQGVHVCPIPTFNWSSGFDNPNDLFSRPYPPLGRYSYVFDNVEISTSGGSSFEGDKWQIEARYDYPIENIFHQVAPSPRIGWRSEKVTSGSVSGQNIAFRFDADTTNNNSENHPNDLMGIHLNGINFKDFVLEYYDGSWQTVANVDNSIGVNCSVDGRTVRGSTGLEEPYFTLNELKDWTCYVVYGGSKDYRKIVSNTEGKLGGNSTNTKQCIITLDTAPNQTATQIYLIPPVITLALNMNSKKSQGFKISILSQETYDKDIRIGECLIGPIVVPGRQYSRGRTISIESGTITNESRDGIRYSKQLKPTEKVYRLAWTDGIDISSLQGDNPSPDYWISSNQANAQPIAIENDAPDLMMNLLDYLQGSVNPIVYIPNISKSSSASGDVRLLQRDKEQALVTLESDVIIESVIGSELQAGNVGEVFRIANITLRQVT